jgi:hypothetical protein
MRVEENARNDTLVLAGAAGAVVSELAAVVTVTVRIGDLLFAASIAITPNTYAVPLYKRVAEYEVTASVVAIRFVGVDPWDASDLYTRYPSIPTLSVEGVHDSEADVAVTFETVIVPGCDGGDVSAAAAASAVISGTSTAATSRNTAISAIRRRRPVRRPLGKGPLEKAVSPCETSVIA